MTAAAARRRARPPLAVWLVFAFLLVAPGRTVAQVTDTVPADAAGADTVVVPIPPDPEERDTAGVARAQQDTAALVPVPPFPRYDRPGRNGFAFGRWEWDRQALLRYHSLSLLSLLERTPGLSAIRMGDFGQAAGLVTMGGGGGRVRVYLDGFELAPLGFTALDAQQIALGDLENVRVERRSDGIRIDLTPLRLPDPRPLSAVEAATGVYDTKLLRGLMMRGIGRKMVVSAAFDQASSQGVGFAQAFSYSAARAALSYAVTPRTVLQAEYRGESAETGRSAVPLDADRRTFLLRGRTRLSQGLSIDAMVGRTQRRPEQPDSMDVQLSSGQAALRVAYDVARVWVEGTARVRGDADELGLPASTFEARAGGILLPLLSAEAEVRQESVLGEGGMRGSGTVRLGPLAGFSGFASVGFGEQGLAVVRDSTLSRLEPADWRIPQEPQETVLWSEPRFSAASSSVASLRAGAEWALPNGSIGAAFVQLPDAVSAPFGFFGLDRGSAPIAVQAINGFEAHASLPVPFTAEFVRLDGWYTHWSDLGGRPYLPEHEGRVAVEAHGIFFGGDLEPSLRVEAVRRGEMLAIASDGVVVPTGAYSMANLLLEIRILDVRAFLVFDNITNIRAAADLPERFLPGSKLYYGLRWTFRN